MNEYLTCKICNRNFKDLSTHIRTHKISKEDYQNKYGKILSWYSDEYRKRKFQLTPEQKAFKDRRIKEAHNTPEVKRIKSRASLGENNGFYGKHHTEFTKNKIRTSVLKILELPNCRKRISNGVKDYIKNHPEYIDKLKNAALNLWKQESYITKHRGKIQYKNLNLRSRLELKVIQELELNDIKFIYEPKRFTYYIDNIKHSYFPDLYLPDFDIYIEIKPSCFIDYNFMKAHNQLHKYNLIILKFNSIEGNKIFITEKDLGNILNCLIT